MMLVCFFSIDCCKDIAILMFACGDTLGTHNVHRGGSREGKEREKVVDLRRITLSSASFTILQRELVT